MSETTTESTAAPAGETSASSITLNTEAAAETPVGIDPSVETNTVDYWKQRSRQNEKAARDNADAAKAAKELKAEFDAFKAKAEGKETEYAAAQEAQKVKDEAIAAANLRILKAELRAAATGKVNPDLLSDLPVLMDLSAFEVSADGEVDQVALAAAISDLITKKPSLAVQDGSRFKGTADGGARNDASKPSQLTQADMARMSPEQIVKADEEGRFDDLRGSR